MRRRIATALVSVLLLTLQLGAANAAIINVPADQPTIAAAVAAAVAGDQVTIDNGTYLISSTLNVTTGITITGQSEAGVILQIDTGASWGISLAADDITLEYVTLDVISTTPEGGYPIHAAGISNPPGGYSNLTIQHVTVQGDATTGPKRRTGVDVHGYNNVILDFITSRDASWGNGVQVTGCVGVTMSNITTLNNSWGSIAIYVSQPAYLNRPSANVTIDGATMSLGESNIYQQDEFAMVSTNVSVTGYEFELFNAVAAPGYTFFVDTEANAVLGALAFTGAESSSAALRVSDGHYIVGAGMNIQTAIDAAPVAGSVDVRAGTFVEQLEIAKDLSLSGAGMGITTVVSPANLPLFFTTSANNFPIVYVHDADNVAITDLSVDGAGLGNANPRFYGVAYRNAGGSFTNSEIRDVRNTPLDGSQHGNAFYLFNDDGISRTIAVQGCTVTGFQKNGITINAPAAPTPVVATITGNTVTGAGVLTFDNGDPAQNGIQLYGALISGLVDGNVIGGIAYDNTNNTTKWVATGILDFYSSANVTNNTLTLSQAGIYKIDAAGAISGNDVTVVKTGVASWGIVASDPPTAVPSPYVSANVTKRPLAKKASISVVADGNTVTFSGMDNTSVFGIEADAGYGANDIAFTATNNVVTGFEAGVDIFACPSGCTAGVFTSVSVNNNTFIGNTFGLRSNVTYLTVDGRCNWHGDLSGPAALSPVNAGTGDAVEGDITYWPWLDGPSGSCNQYGGDVIAPTVAVEINPCTPCVTVPIDLSRTDLSTLRGVSVTFQLSPELELCGSGVQAAVGPGSLFDGYANTNFFLLDNGGGSYTADLTLLGTPCGPTTGGTVITVDVTNVAGIVTDTTGSITVTGVTVRDCNNAPLPAVPGPAGTVVINNATPAAIADLAASQLKIGNDSDGTTKINLSWTAPVEPDVVSIDVYRKGFGFYPEYDDLGGSAPAAPADPATATGAGWVLAASLPPGSASYVDETTNRDFWYYVAFVSDGCNISGNSNRTNGTLNYHLGDVSITPGDNLVSTLDISALGASYGTSDGDVNYDNELDVGPTTDFFVNARPTTDNQIQFEDLMMFAINHGQVSKAPTTLTSAGENRVELVVRNAVAVGETLELSVLLSGDGSLRGLSTDITWDRDKLAYLGFRTGDLMAAQGGLAPVYSPRPGRLDTAVFGPRSDGILGQGTLAVLRFRVLEGGDLGLGIERSDGRSLQNEPIAVDSSVRAGGGTVPGTVVTELLPNMPNPFNPATTIRFRLAQSGDVRVRIYSLQGRLVRTLVQEPMKAGLRSMVWTGVDDAGRSVASGTYVVRLESAGRSDTQHIVLLK